jgi:hypothetical protein
MKYRWLVEEGFRDTVRVVAITTAGFSQNVWADREQYTSDGAYQSRDRVSLSYAYRRFLDVVRGGVGGKGDESRLSLLRCEEYKN